MSMGLGGIFGDVRMPWEKTMPGGFDMSGGKWGVNPDLPEVAAPKAKKGLFGSGIGIGDILGAIGDGLLMNNGAEPIYTRSKLMGRKAAYESEQEARRRAAEREDWLWKQQNTAPKVNDTVADFEWYKNLSPQDRALYEQMRPQYRQGPDGQFYRVQVAPEPQAPPAGVTFTPIPAPGGQPAGTPPFAGKAANGFVPPATIPSGRMTSGRRTPEGNKLVGGVPNSKHLGPGAADYWGADLNAVLADVRKFPGFRRALIHNAGSGKHVHAEGEGWNTPYYGKRGTRGLGGK